MQRAFDCLDVVGMRDAHVELCLGIRGDDVLGGPAGDRADVHGDAALVIGERVHADDLLGELLDGACTLEQIRSRVRRPAFDRDAKPPETLARRFQVALRGRGLDDEGCSHAVHGFAQWLACSAAALLLVGRDEDTERAAPAPRLVDRGQQQDEARLHVIDAGAACDVALGHERHRREGAFGPDRVAVADDGEWRTRSGQVRPYVAALEHGRLGSACSQLARHHLCDLTDTRGAGGRLDLDEPSQERNGGVRVHAAGRGLELAASLLHRLARMLDPLGLVRPLLALDERTLEPVERGLVVARVEVVPADVVEEGAEPVRHLGIGRRRGRGRCLGSTTRASSRSPAPRWPPCAQHPPPGTRAVSREPSRMRPRTAAARPRHHHPSGAAGPARGRCARVRRASSRQASRPRRAARPPRRSDREGLRPARAA